MTLEDRRLKLHEALCVILGSRHVYYDPPESIVMKYPAIVYSKARINDAFADNKKYLGKVSYEGTLIRKDDDDDILDRILELPYTTFGRAFTSSNLHHDTFTTFI
jgi:hypothetical protein